MYWGVCARDVSAFLLDAKAVLRLLVTPDALPFVGCGRKEREGRSGRG